MNMKMREEKKAVIRDLIRTAVAEDAFPCASILAGTPDEVLLEYTAGSRSVYPERLPLNRDTLFDMASLTKVLATAPLAMAFVEQGKISLADKVADYLPPFSDGPGKEITLGQLLTHTAGLAPDLALYDLCDKPEDDIMQIAEHGIRFPAGIQVTYSDLGFIVMGRVLEAAGEDTLDHLSAKYLYQPMGMRHTGFCPASDNVAATEENHHTCRIVNGLVHDENARFLGGVAGHAGLFSHASDISKYAVLLLSGGKIGNRRILSKASIAAMTRNYTYALGEDRGLGWSLKTDRVPGTDSYANAGGELALPGSYGHTGFTGTSIWLDNFLGVYLICLTNRVHYGRENQKIIRFRRLLHNMFFSSLE